MEEPKGTGTLKRERGIEKSEYIDHTIKSPCIGVCMLDKKAEYCVGCYRTVNDLRDWCIMTSEEKKDVLMKCQEKGRQESIKEAEGL